MRFHEIINEGVNDQFLYHGVPNGQTVMKIIKSESIQPAEPFDFDYDREIEQGKTPKDRISLTRSQYLRFPYGGAVAQFVIDKNALQKHGYKVEPVAGAGIAHKGETEEQVFKDIPVRLPFVVAIQYDPEIEIPKAFFNKVKSLGIRLEPWRKKAADSTPEKKIKSASKYTDPNKLKLKSQDWFGNVVWNISYDTGDGHSSIIHPYYLNKDENATKKAYHAIKDRIAKGLSFADLLPANQYGKNWKRGKYTIQYGDPDYKNDSN
jgi:hypothetical protein